jgi:hypothetical protein
MVTHIAFIIIKEARTLVFSNVMRVGFCINTTSVIVFLKVRCMKNTLALSRMAFFEVAFEWQGVQNPHFQYNST